MVARPPSSDPTAPASARAGRSALAARRIAFDYPPDLDVAWIPARPEFACAANSISLLMPYMEPYFVRTVAAVVDELDGEVGSAARGYLGQEGAHHRQHRRYNRLLTDRYPGLRRVERWAAFAYRWLGRTRSSSFNLAFVAASETIAYSAARWSAGRRRDLFEGADPIVASLFLWHLAEEVEHKSVAWDVFVACGGTRRRYGLAAVAALALVAVFVGTGSTVMLAAERRLLNPLSWLRLGGWAVTFAFELVANLVVSVLPGHHPDDFTDPLWFEVWLREYDATTGTLPLWTAGERRAEVG